MKNDILQKDLKSFLSIYSKFKKVNIPRKKIIILRGQIDVCDVKGNYFKTFDLDIIINKYSYPYTIPEVKERSKFIERNQEWHINNEGFCCLDMDHKLIKMSQRGIHIGTFYRDVIYPFFCNTVFKQLYNNYANGEYPHEFEGVQSFYKNELNLNNPELILKVLRSIKTGKTPGRNQLCVCENDKYKNCKKHFESIEFLKNLPTQRILVDLKYFEEKLLGHPNNIGKAVRIL